MMMQSLMQLAETPHLRHLSRAVLKSQISSVLGDLKQNKFFKQFSTKNGDDEWNDAWESAWLPEDLSAKNRAPWETDVDFSSTDATVVLPSNVDAETKAFVEEMTDNWHERRRRPPKSQHEKQQLKAGDNSLYSVENIKKDYRLKKQRIHAGLWMKEIEKQEEAKLGGDGGDDIERLLDSYSEIFDSSNSDLTNSKVSNTSEFKTKPDGWETMSKPQDGNIWEISQKEEDILIQEFERRMAFSKFQIATFLKSHIFSRRRPIDGWKYMIEVLGPNAKRGKGSVSRLPSLSDAATEPFVEERTAIGSNLASSKGKY